MANLITTKQGNFVTPLYTTSYSRNNDLVELVYLKFGNFDQLKKVAQELAELIQQSIPVEKHVIASAGGYEIPNAQRLLADQVANILRLEHLMFKTSMFANEELRDHYTVSTRQTQDELHLLGYDDQDTDGIHPLNEKDIILIDDVIVRGGVIDDCVQSLNNKKPASIQSFVAYYLLGKYEHLERKAIEGALREDIGILTKSLINPKNIYTTRAIWYTFAQDESTFKRILNQVDPFDHFNLYLYSLQYFGGNYPGVSQNNFQTLGCEISNNLGLELPDITLLKGHGEERFNEVIRLLQIKDYRVTEQNTQSNQEIASHVYSLFAEEKISPLSFEALNAM